MDKKYEKTKATVKQMKDRFPRLSERVLSNKVLSIMEDQEKLGDEDGYNN